MSMGDFTIEDGQSESIPTLEQRLRDFLTEEYVYVGMNMPEVSQDIWGMVMDDIFADDDASVFGQQQEFFTFLKKFFSEKVVTNVENVFHELHESSLKVPYTLRYPMGHVAVSILFDISDDFHRNSYLLMESGVSKEASSENRGNSSDDLSVNLKSTDQGHDKEHGDSRDNENKLPDNVSERLDFGDVFRSVPQVEIVVTPLTTRGVTIQERGNLFVEQLPSHALYDPRSEVKRFVTMFHGTRRSSISRFQSKGIDPIKSWTEFSISPAFYVTNSPKQAYEHPLHQHVAWHPDPVSVIEFVLNTGVIHGDLPFDLFGTYFKVKWFRSADDEWKDFCLFNLIRKGFLQQHNFDIVIGPMCLPNTETGFLELKIFGDVPLTQVAFCSKRAMRWVNDCVSKIFLEMRRE